MDSEPSSTHEEALEQFVLLWGKMASAWGINKTMAQIHALLYAEEDPLDTNAIMNQLEISRGNANMNLRKLLQWDLIQKEHFKGNRKDFFTAEKDVWTIISTIIRERQEREVVPIRKNLNKTLNLFDDPRTLSEKEQGLKERIENFTEFLEKFERFTDALLPYINEKNLKFLKHLVKLAEMKKSITGNTNPDDNE